MESLMEGRLSIILSLQHEASAYKVNKVCIDSTRPAIATQLFKGKSASDTLRLLPLVFSICANAQACAGVRAIEQAMNITTPDYIEWLRSKLVILETLREHIWRILLDWPNYLEKETDTTKEKQVMAQVIALINRMQSLLKKQTDPFNLSNSYNENGELKNHNEFQNEWYNATEEWKALLEKSVFYSNLEEWLNIQDEPGLHQWIEANPSALGTLIQKIITRHWGEIGRCHSETLPDLCSANEQYPIATAMQQLPFTIQGQKHDSSYDSSSLTRVNSTLLSALTTQYGNGLLPRIMARLTELARLSMNLGNEHIEPQESLQPHPNSSLTGSQSASRFGIGQVYAARGTLIHQVQLDRDNIMDYQILAPTDLHFSPHGLVAQALSQLEGTEEDIKQQASFLIEAIDPCVSYDLQWQVQETAYA